MSCIAIIPARGGSKGIPLKNLRKLGGVRLIERSIQAARACDEISRVYVSTDCRQIANSANRAGATVITRPDQFSGDAASSEAALTHCLESIGSGAILPKCTSPFTAASEISATLAPLISGDADSTFLARRSHKFLWREGENGEFQGINHKHMEQRIRRQDLDPEFFETGAIYGLTVDRFMKEGNRFSGRVKAVEGTSDAVDIDEMSDFLFAHSCMGKAVSNRVMVASSAWPKAVITDFDGVHTDGSVILTQDGTEAVKCSRLDGMGISLAKKRGIEVLILSKEKNHVVSARAEKLSVECIQGCDRKIQALSEWLDSRDLYWDDIVYVGDDINDLDCIQLAGFSVCPANATKIIKKFSDLHLQKRGGEGCLREFIDQLLGDYL
jgi:YrbI family 3-deoxy-D-manno-octulosonate 8-phosphate phosphatase